MHWYCPCCYTQRSVVRFIKIMRVIESILNTLVTVSTAVTQATVLMQSQNLLLQDQNLLLQDQNLLLQDQNLMLQEWAVAMSSTRISITVSIDAPDMRAKYNRPSPRNKFIPIASNPATGCALTVLFLQVYPVWF